MNHQGLFPTRCSGGQEISPRLTKMSWRSTDTGVVTYLPAVVMGWGARSCECAKTIADNQETRSDWDWVRTLTPLERFGHNQGVAFCLPTFNLSFSTSGVLGLLACSIPTIEKNLPPPCLVRRFPLIPVAWRCSPVSPALAHSQPPYLR